MTYIQQETDIVYPHGRWIMSLPYVREISIRTPAKIDPRTLIAGAIVLAYSVGSPVTRIWYRHLDDGPTPTGQGCVNPSHIVHGRGCGDPKPSRRRTPHRAWLALVGRRSKRWGTVRRALLRFFRKVVNQC